MSTRIAYDTFTGVDGTLLTAHTLDVGGPWVKVGGTPNAKIFTNKTSTTTNDANPTYYKVSLVGIVDYVQATITRAAANQSGGGITLGEYTFCFWGYDWPNPGYPPRYVHLYHDGVEIASAAHDPAYDNGGIMKMSISGNTVSCYLGGALIIGPLAHSAIVSPSAGIMFIATANWYDTAIDTFDFWGTATPPPAAPTLLTSSCVTGLGESDVAGAPTTSASADVTSGYAPLAVNFTDRSGMTPTSWLWEFGDGTTSALQNPSHTYTAAGTYSVRLTATNAQGSSSYRLTIVALDAAVVTPPTGGIVVPVGSSGVSLHGLSGKIGYYAVDRQGNQVKIHSTTGSLLKTFGGIGTAAGKFYMPTTVSVINGRQALDRVTIEED